MSMLLDTNMVAKQLQDGVESGLNLGFRPVKAATQAINVLVEIRADVRPQRIQDNTRTLASSHLGCRHEIRIPSHQYQEIRL